MTDGAARDGALRELEERLGHRFERGGRILEALTHRSSAFEQPQQVPDYERLEFLGDAVLGLVAAGWTFQAMPEAPEGDLARIKSHLVSAPVLAAMARELELGPCLLLSPAEERSGGREKESILADALEAVLGVAFLEAGFAGARDIIEPLLERAYREAPSPTPHDVKNRLQERLQAEGRAVPEYRVVEERGPDHDRTFVIECRIEDEVYGTGTGRNKKEAERAAAQEALSQLVEEG